MFLVPSVLGAQYGIKMASFLGLLVVHWKPFTTAVCHISSLVAAKP
jgi:hypothetical protein